MKYALIDMGSNSIRLTVYEVDQRTFQVLFKEKLMAGLAGYVEQGRLTRDGINCACTSLQTFLDTLRLLGIDNLAVFATASLRNITNTDQALQQIRQTTGITVEVLTGEQEASFGFYGAICDSEISRGLFADIGGASTELAAFSEKTVLQAGSVPVGSLRLYRDCVKNILPGKGSVHRINEAIKLAFQSSTLTDLSPADHLICVGGTARATLRLCQKLFGLPDDCKAITKTQLHVLSQQLCMADQNAAQLILRYEPERIHTLIPGIMILQYIMKQYGVSEVEVSRYGVREGYLKQMIQPKLEE